MSLCGNHDGIFIRGRPSVPRGAALAATCCHSVVIMRFITYPLEYYLLHGVRPDGPTVGHYSGKPVADVVIDAYERRYVFTGLAPRRNDGRYDLGKLRDGEFLLEPGLVYRLQ